MQDNAELLQTIQRMQREIDMLKTRETPYPAWTDYTPTITAGTGTFTAVSASGKYARVGNIMHVNVAVIITTNGTAAGYIIVPLPAATAATALGCGRENTVTGNMLQVIVVAGTSVARAFTYNNTYPGGDGRTLYMTVAYPV